MRRPIAAVADFIRLLTAGLAGFRGVARQAVPDCGAAGNGASGDRAVSGRGAMLRFGMVLTAVAVVAAGLVLMGPGSGPVADAHDPEEVEVQRRIPPYTEDYEVRVAPFTVDVEMRIPPYTEDYEVRVAPFTEDYEVRVAPFTVDVEMRIPPYTEDYEVRVAPFTEDYEVRVAPFTVDVEMRIPPYTEDYEVRVAPFTEDYEVRVAPFTVDVEMRIPPYTEDYQVRVPPYYELRPVYNYETVCIWLGCFEQRVAPFNETVVVYNYETRTRDVYNYQTVTRDVFNYETRTRDVYNYQTRTRDVYNYQTVTRDVFNYETRTRDVFNYETVTRDVFNYETRTRDVFNYETVTRDVFNYETRTRDVYNYQTVTRDVFNYETRTRDVYNYETITHQVHDDDHPSHQTETDPCPGEDSHPVSAGSTSCHSHPVQPCHATDTVTYQTHNADAAAGHATVTLQPCPPPDPCPGEDSHPVSAGSTSCHSHPVQPCHATDTVTYQTHNADAAAGHATVTLQPCPPPDPCPGEDSHPVSAGSTSCHSHPVQPCHATDTVTYQTHNADAAAGHATVTLQPCPPPDPCPGEDSHPVSAGSTSCHSHPVQPCHATDTVTYQTHNADAAAGHALVTLQPCPPEPTAEDDVACFAAYLATGVMPTGDQWNCTSDRDTMQQNYRAWQAAREADGGLPGWFTDALGSIRDGAVDIAELPGNIVESWLIGFGVQSPSNSAERHHYYMTQHITEEVTELLITVSCDPYAGEAAGGAVAVGLWLSGVGAGAAVITGISSGAGITVYQVEHSNCDETSSPTSPAPTATPIPTPAPTPASVYPEGVDQSSTLDCLYLVTYNSRGRHNGVTGCLSPALRDRYFPTIAANQRWQRTDPFE